MTKWLRLSNNSFVAGHVQRRDGGGCLVAKGVPMILTAFRAYPITFLSAPILP